MRNRVVRTCSGGVLPLLVSLGTMQGCATNKSPLATASTVDREFAAAAVTWDLNRDGNVTCDEWKQYASDLFRAADVNHDGVLKREEFAILTRQDKLFEVAGFSYFDADGDGQITLSEVVGPIPPSRFSIPIMTAPMRDVGGR